MKKNHLVVAVAYDGLCTFEFGCTVELFALARPELEVDWYRFAVCAERRGKLHAAGGISVEAPYTLALLDKADTIIMPGWRDADEAPPPPLLKKIRAAHERGARICSICSGVFVLAAAGILDGRTATTHWRYAEALATRYPAVRVEVNALYVDEGRILTSAGSAAGIDMMLHLVRKDFGAKTANLVAQRLVVQPHRDGGQAQFVPRPIAPASGNRLARLMDFVRANPGKPHTLDSLAKAAAMSRRTLQRQFQEAAGVSPMEWLLRERIAIARELLEAPMASLPSVAAAAGFGSEESFRLHFRRLVGVSPGAYRRTHRAA
jgi:AraC family transcriptional regulator, transcriptional activator FtrA